MVYFIAEDIGQLKDINFLYFLPFSQQSGVKWQSEVQKGSVKRFKYHIRLYEESLSR